MVRRKIKNVTRIQRSAASKIQRAVRGGLNKKEKKQTKAIVASAIKKEHVLKYFNSQSNDDPVAPTIIGVSTAKKEVSVIGFSSTTEFDNAGATVQYGTQEYQPLYLARPFKENESDEALAAQALNGQYCLPKMAKTSFSIERVVMLSPDNDAGTPKANSAECLPIQYRIIKVGIKAQLGTQNDIDPNVDLFINSYGQPTGVEKDDFDRLDCRYSPINTKKYTKLMDLTGVISQNNIITPLIHPRTTGAATDMYSQKNGKSVVHFTIPFQLSQRKGGKLFYETPQQAGTGPKSFNSGGQRQLVLCHFWYDNGHTLLGGGGQPNAPTSTDLQIKTKSTSAFVDAQ